MANPQILQRIPADAAQKRKLILHILVFIIVNAILWYLSYSAGKGKAFNYPWPIWITSAWGLGLIAHGLAIFYKYEDKGIDKYLHDEKN